MVTEEMKESLVREYYGDGSSSTTPLTKLVDYLLTPYGGIPKDHSDYYDVANETFVQCLNSYDGSKGARFDTYLSGCLDRKIKTYISYSNREKRRNRDSEGNYIPDESLDRVISSEASGGSETTIGSLITDRSQNVEGKLFDELGGARDYIDALGTNEQKQIARYIASGFSHVDIRKKMGIEVKDYNRILNEMKSFEKAKILRRNTNTKHTHNSKRRTGMGMMVEKTSNNSEKSMNEVFTTMRLIKEIDEAKVLTDHPLQRESNQWANEYKGNLITTILNNYKFSPLVMCQEYKGDEAYNWLIDGKQRATTIYEYRNNRFKISKKAMYTNIKYKTLRRDEEGNIEKDEVGRPYYDIHVVDVADKKFSDLPEELQEIFDYYHIQIETYLNCTEEEIQYHIIRYNDAKPMSLSSKGTLKLGEEFAQAMKTIIAKNPMFNEYRNLTGLARAKADALHRVIIESIITSFYIDNWNCNYDKNCSFIANNGTVNDFEEFSMLMDNMTQVIDEETGKLLSRKNAFIWIAVFNTFVGMMEDNSNLKYSDFMDFMKEFSSDLINKSVFGVSFAELDEKATKDTTIVTRKIDTLVALLREFLGVHDDDPKEVIEESEKEVEEVSEESVQNDINIEETPSMETEIRPEIKAETVPFDEGGEVVEEPVTAEEKPVEEPEMVQEEATENEVDPNEDAMWDYIDRFNVSEIVRRIGGDQSETNRAALATLMMLDNKGDMSREAMNAYLAEKDFLNNDAQIGTVMRMLDKVNTWSVVAVGNNKFVTMKNLPVLVCLAMMATRKGVDDRKCKNWLETFAFTFASKGLEDKEYCELAKVALEDLKRACSEEPKKRPKLNF